MKNRTFENIVDSDRCLFRTVRGSHVHGLSLPTSDIDTGGLFYEDTEQFLGLGFGLQDQVGDAKSDNVLYEIGKFCRLLTKSNPNVLELLFTDEKFWIKKPSPLIMPLFENRDKFISKKCFDPFIGFSISQIKKCRGLNKKINNPMVERKTQFDFCYTFQKQGSTKFVDWLNNRGLFLGCCGLVNVPNMHNIYGVYYDWGKHFQLYGTSNLNENTVNFIFDFYRLEHEGELHDFIENNKEVKGYIGINFDRPLDERCSLVKKGEEPICQISYNESGFQDHCKKYKEYQEWVENRNPVRYESNLTSSYDCKNVAHAFRIMHMGKEIAEGKGMQLFRTWDRQFLLDIRNHKYEYEEIAEKLEEEMESLKEATEMSTIPDDVDIDFLNDFLIDFRLKALAN